MLVISDLPCGPPRVTALVNIHDSRPACDPVMAPARVLSDLMQDNMAIKMSSVGVTRSTAARSVQTIAIVAACLEIGVMLQLEDPSMVEICDDPLHQKRWNPAVMGHWTLLRHLSQGPYGPMLHAADAWLKADLIL